MRIRFIRQGSNIECLINSNLATASNLKATSFLTLKLPIIYDVYLKNWGQENVSYYK
jgi:hypothetical protein